MNMKLTDIMGSYKKALRLLKTKSDAEPARDWLVLLILVLLFIVASVAWNVWFFLESVSEKETVSVEEQEEVVDVDTTGKIRQTFMLRGEEEGRYRNVYEFIDPSR